jgi:putative endonuclease
MSYHVYALYSASLDMLYIGQTNDLQKRLHDHHHGYSKFTSRAKDWVLVYNEEVINRSSAMRRERQLKSFRGREFLRSLVSQNT